MSRTRHSKKSPGYEYWSRRPGNKHGGEPGKVTKRKTHKAERRFIVCTECGYNFYNAISVVRILCPSCLYKSYEDLND